MFILGAMFVLVVLFVPGGIAGSAKRLFGRSRSRAGAPALEAAGDQEHKVLEASS
jgi:branched-chain amino acid transport system permease protein